MFRVTKMTNQWYALDFGDEIDEEAAEEILIFASEGTPVVIVEDLADMENFGVSEDEIITLTKDD